MVQNNPEQLAIDGAVSLPQLDWQERLNILHNDFGFVPTTKVEQNVAFGAIPFIDEPGGVGAHLNEVLKHQEKAETDDPRQALRKLVRDMGQYRKDAQTRRQGLLEVHHALQVTNPELDISRVGSLNLLGLLSVVQYHRILEGAHRGSDVAMRGRVKTVGGRNRLVTAFDIETNDEVSTDMLVESLPDTRVLAVRGQVLAAGKSHRNRVIFWREMLESSKSHAAVRPVVNEILSHR